MGLRVQSTVGCFPELCFLQFSVAHVLVGLRKQFINNFLFPTWTCAVGFNNNNKKNNNDNNTIIFTCRLSSMYSGIVSSLSCLFFCFTGSLIPSNSLFVSY